MNPKRPLLPTQINEELAQAKARLVMCVSFFALIAGLELARTEESPRFVLSLWVLGPYILGAIGWWRWVQRVPDRQLWRRQVAAPLDVGLALSGMALMGSSGAWIYPALLWTIIGHGMRFGPRTLLSGTAFGTVGFATILFLHPEWRALGNAATGMLCGTFVFPLVFRKLVARLHALTERLSQELVRSEAAAKAKGEFLANMSHEIRTPMNGVVGMTELLLDSPLSSEQREYTEAIHASGLGLITIINDILDFSKIEAGRFELERVEFAFQTFLDEMNDLLAVRAHAQDLAFACVVDPRIPSHLVGDPLRLRQVLTNLIGNAIKFTPAGSVGLRVELAQEQGDEIVLRFSISDTGIGIAEQTRERLFQAFTQADASTTRNFGGTGLGLAISKQLVELMDGAIEVESELGVGTTFTFTLPFTRQHHRRALPAALRARGAPRVLLVQPHDLTAEALGAILASWRFESARESDLTTGLARLAAAREAGVPFDVIVVDRLALRDDRETWAGTLEDGGLRDVTRILTLPLGIPLDPERLAAGGFVSHVTRPVKPSSLLNALLLGLCPEALEPEPEPEVTPAAPLPSGEGRVLLVEDNAINRKLALVLLSRLGLEVEVATDGAEALERLSREVFDLVLMDCQMPVLDGYEASRVIRDPSSSVLRHGVPIIALTANAMAGDRERCLEAGMDDYVSKPIRRERLEAALERWLTPATVPADEV